jgi:Ca2+-binding RTX toxin-like protein
MSGGVLTFEADAGEQNTVDINRTSDGFAQVWGGSSVDLEILTPGTCSPSPPVYVECDLPQRVVVKTGDENDDARSIDFPAEIQLGPGDDEVLSGRFADTIIGGDGRDSVSYFESAQGGPRRTSGVTVTDDGRANDGASGEGDNVDASVEVVSGTGMDDRLVGDDGPQELQGGGGNDVLEGAAGNDMLSGSAGDDVLNGGAGDDSIDGDADGDRIDAGSGRDQVRGDQPCRVFTCGGGPDQITVRDGEPDTVQCGIGHDRVIADAIDGVQRDGFEVCEQVELPIATPPAQPAPATTRPAPSAGAGMVRVASNGRCRGSCAVASS